MQNGAQMLLMFWDLQNIHFIFVLLMYSHTHSSALIHAFEKSRESMKANNYTNNS